MKTIKREEMRMIGHWRGFTQYEITSDMSLLVLTHDDKHYYLSKCEEDQDYNSNIIRRICGFYGDEGRKALGEEIEVI